MTIATSGSTERLWTTQRWAFIASVLGLMTCIAFESFAVTTILPVAMSELGGKSWYSLAYSATITAGLVGMVLGGSWTDRSGCRSPLIFGGGLFLLGLLLCVVAPNAFIFIVGRLLQGVGGGIDSVVLYVLIARKIPEALRPRMFGLLTAAWLVPSVAGPAISGALAELTSWRAVFVVVLAGSALSLLFLVHVARDVSATSEDSAPGQRVLGRRGAFSVLAALLLLGLHMSTHLPPPASVLMVVVALSGLVFTANWVLPSGTVRLSGAPQRFIGLRALLGSTVTSTGLYLTLYLQVERDYRPTAAGLIIAVSAFGWAIGAWLQGRFSSGQVTHRRIILCATPLIGLGPAVVLSYTVTSVPLFVVVVGCIAMGVGMGMAFPRVASATLELVEPHQQGAFSSGLQAGESMSVAVTTALTGAILTLGLPHSVAYPAVYTCLLCMSAAALCLALFIYRQREISAGS